MKTTFVVAVLALVLAGNASSATFSKRTLSDARLGKGKAELVAQIDFSTRMEHFFQVKHHWMIAARHGNCWSHVPWAKTCNRARLTLRRHERLHSIAQERYDRLYGFPSTNDWLTAITIVQRWFPGSYQWLYDCSSSEGGHGNWIRNRRGSGAGGWMQYMSGTFYGDFDGAAAYLLTFEHVRVPVGLRDWYSELGQAIAGGWAYGHNRPSGKWTGGSCY